MTAMSRSISASLLAAAACLVAVPAQAQNVVLYGLLDASGSHVRPVGGQGRFQLDDGNLQRSFIGFRGNEDLGGGLRAVFRLESYFRTDTGTSGRADGDGFFSREASVGLSGAFGTTVLGRNPTPLYSATINFNPFGEGFGFSPSTRQYFGTRGVILGDSRWNNSISYTNNGVDPLRVNIVANTPEEAQGAADSGRNYGGSWPTSAGRSRRTLVAERIKNSPLGVPTGFRRQFAFQAGATYDFSVVRLYGQVGRIKTDAALDQTTLLYQVGRRDPHRHQPHPRLVRALALEDVLSRNYRPDRLDRLRLLPVEEHRHLRRRAVREAHQHVERETRSPAASACASSRLSRGRPRRAPRRPGRPVRSTRAACPSAPAPPIRPRRGRR